MLASEMIKHLQALIETHGDVPIYITESGYYSAGPFAEIFPPEETTVEVYDYVNKKTDYRKVWHIGHSHQSY